MKRAGSLLFLLTLGALAPVLSSCVTRGRVSGGVAISYGPYHAWIHDRPWFDGWPVGRGGIYIQPPPVYIGPPRWPPVPNRPRAQRRP